MKTVFSLAVVEGDLEIPVTHKLLRATGIDSSFVRIINTQGRSKFWKSVGRYNAAAIHNGPVWGLADLESDPCANWLFERHLRGNRQPGFILRIAVKMLESWLLADRDTIADYLGVSRSEVPTEPEQEVHPKRTIVNLARKSSKRQIRENLIPSEKSCSSVGFGYTPILTRYVTEYWRPLIAQKRSSSLERALKAIDGVRVS
jgi:hypothetical protein